MKRGLDNAHFTDMNLFAAAVLSLPSAILLPLAQAVSRPNFRLEDAVDLRRGEAVTTSLPATSNVTLPNFGQCLRLCWYATNCADISYNFETKTCRLFDVTSHSLVLAVVENRAGETFASVFSARMDKVITSLFTYCLSFYRVYPLNVV